TVSGSPGTAMANTWTWYAGNGRGLDIKPDGSTVTLHLPASGIRNYSHGRLYYNGANCYYWSTAFSGVNACFFLCNSVTVNPAYSVSRGYGGALRCIRNS
ncbi:MAG: hypothetical protein LBS01_07625, partial [Prevotellaceae bacterium]|nr:hypothetical protein [Prevotellaceae bacterium]